MGDPSRTTQELRTFTRLLGKQNTATKAIRVILVDGRELVRHGFRHILESEEGIKVVGDYDSAEEALFEMARFHSDIVLMGTWLPGMNWLQATRSLKRNNLHSGVDVIILAESGHSRDEALEAGAAGYLLKDITGTELVQNIRQVYQNSHPPKEHVDFVDEVVELVVPPPVNATQLLRFISQLAEILHDGFDSIICTVGSPDRGTVITIRSQGTASAGLLFQLANMPEVEKVGEEPLTSDTFSSLFKKVGFLPRLGINPSKKLCVTLQDTSMASQKTVALLN